MTKLFAILFASLFTKNIVCYRYIGVNGGTLSSDTFRKSVYLGAFSTAGAILSTVVCYPVFAYLLIPLKLSALFTLLYASVTAAVMFLSHKYLPFLKSGFDKYQLLVAYGISLGIAALCAMEQNVLYALLAALFYGLGLLLVLAIFYCVQLSLKHSRVPEFLKGTPLDLVIVSIISLIFYGLA
ncbi:MAG: hypothetical protein IIW16_03160 [Clostridia bacterium]|nr:hypothetical protein [Clostridia bacterium]MBQ2274403.1 hypothetical protein [Clostridia bacterium]MBQ5798795.1 hypothetical protein [Clostridia bacterium]MEE1277435.1 Rnf-Nqr domain containing protein [Acutalibacteraceae bacterium]